MSAPSPEATASGDAASGDAAPGAEPLLLAEPADRVPPVVDDERRLVEVARSLAAGTGPLALDAERASGYRYGQRAYLVQFRRAGAGTWLIDPIGCPDLRPLADAVAGTEWILHAATQDLPCLAEVGLRPTRLFDTELGARLAGLPKVGLAAVVEHYLGVRLAKEHSAVDWSTRPLPEPWLAYAALDVALLAGLRDEIEADLRDQGKLGWAREEFDHLRGFTGPPPRADPWRRTSGMHKVRSRRTSAVIRQLWYARDDLARRRDVSPGRILTDASLLALAVAAPRSPEELARATRSRSVRRHGGVWLAAIERALALPESQLPPVHAPSDAPPPARAWTDRNPVAAARLAAARAGLGAFADEHRLPVENLLSPDTLRRVLWAPPEPTDDAVRAALAAHDARAWQIEIAAPIIRRALAAPA